MMIPRRARPAFTLLEIMLAMLIGLMLLSALYVTLDAQLKNSQAAREMVEQSNLASRLLTRMEGDIKSTITLANASRFRTPSSGGSSSGGTSGTSGTTGSTTGASGTSGTSSTSTTAAIPIYVPLGVYGTDTSLNIFAGRVPRAAVEARSTDIVQPISDTRRLSYWLVGDPGNAAGLAKQEVPLITSEDAVYSTNWPPSGGSNENDFIIASEVRSLTFAYFDGTNWNDTWDSTMLGSDGMTPIGPPAAIRIDILLPSLAGPDADPKKYSHTVSLITTNGTQPMQLTSTGFTQIVVNPPTGGISTTGGGPTSP